MKTWAKVHNINSSKDGTLNSLSIILLVTFHLQVRFVMEVMCLTIVLLLSFEAILFHWNAEVNYSCHIYNLFSSSKSILLHFT